jgi:FMN phosphatase YigB (HAD superfamily)
MSGVRVVCFDWGGVILRICRSWDEGCARAGVPVHEATRTAVHRARRRELAERYQCGAMSCEAFFEGLSASTGGLVSAAEARRIHDAWLVEEYDGVDALIDALHAAGTTTAMLSNTNRTHWSRQHGGAGGFPSAARLGIRLASHELGCAKPDPAIYLAATRRFGVAPSEILFFDDLAENVDGARRAGWRAELVDHEGDTAAQMNAHLVAAGVLGPDAFSRGVR